MLDGYYEGMGRGETHPRRSGSLFLCSIFLCFRNSKCRLLKHPCIGPPLTVRHYLSTVIIDEKLWDLFFKQNVGTKIYWSSCILYWKLEQFLIDRAYVTGFEISQIWLAIRPVVVFQPNWKYFVLVKMILSAVVYSLWYKQKASAGNFGKSPARDISKLPKYVGEFWNITHGIYL